LDTQLQLNCIKFRQERGKYWQRYDGIGLRCEGGKNVCQYIIVSILSTNHLQN